MAVQVIFSRNAIDQAAMDRVYDGADSELVKIAKEIASDAKKNAPRSLKKKAKRSKSSQRYGPLRRTVRAVRKGKRMRQNGKWRFLATKIAIQFAFYGRFLDLGWNPKVRGKVYPFVEGNKWMTEEINRRLVRA